MFLPTQDDPFLSSGGLFSYENNPLLHYYLKYAGTAHCDTHPHSVFDYNH